MTRTELNEFPHAGVERLAQVIHESAREAVLSGATVAHDKFGENAKRFTEWNELTENAREGKRMQAQYLIDLYHIIPKLVGEDDDSETNNSVSSQLNSR